MRYHFGKNWQKYLRHFTDERVSTAINCLQSLTRDIKNRSFLDIGCGSGLHSLAALRAGAREITSFDYDYDAVAATTSLWEKEGRPKHWTILQGSVLDANFMQLLPKADIVYSWGVLHHTGNVWQSIRNASTAMHNDSLFCIALYSASIYENAQIYGCPSPHEWIKIKQNYNCASSLGKKIMEYAYAAGYYSGGISLRNLPQNMQRLFNQIRNYGKQRGMEYWTDIRDWLGGLPMEFVREFDCAKLCINELNLKLVKLNTGEGNTEYVFQKENAATQYTETLQKRTFVELAAPFEVNDPLVWRANLPDWKEYADNKIHPKQSTLLLWEDGIPLSLPHCTYDCLKHFGNGRYRHWEDKVYFSTSDNSNPNTNGRSYMCSIDSSN